MTDTTLMSVLLVTYNHEKFIAQALDSILMQQADFAFEIVAVDDCSTDNTLAILRQYESQHPQLRVLPTENKLLGISRNYQRGFAACRGEFVAVLEGDDYWISPRKLQMAAGFLKRNPACSFCFHRIIRHDSHPETAIICPPNWTVEQILTVDELASGNFIGGFSTCVYRREIIANQPPELWELDIREWFFNVVVAQHGPIGYIPQVLSVYRAHEGGIWSMRSPAEHLAELSRLISCYDDFLNFRFAKEFEEAKSKYALTFSRRETPISLYWRVRIWLFSLVPVQLKERVKRLMS
jgi:glycosyltransferase involved in cell wall biosynthesis